MLNSHNLDADERIAVTLKFLHGLKSGTHARGVVHSDLGISDEIGKPDFFDGIIDLSPAHAKQIRDILVKFTRESTSSIDKAIDVFENVRLERKLERFENTTKKQIAGLQPKKPKYHLLEDDYDVDEEIEENIKEDEKILKQIKAYEDSLKIKKEFIRHANSLARELRTSLTKTDSLSEHNKLILTALDKLQKKVGKKNYDIESPEVLEKIAINEFTEVLGIKAFDQLNTIADVRDKLKKINSDYEKNVDNWRDYRKTISESQEILSALKAMADEYLPDTLTPNILYFDIESLKNSTTALDKILRKGVKIENSIDDIDKFNNKSKASFAYVKNNFNLLQSNTRDCKNSYMNTLCALLPPDDDSNKNKIKLRSMFATYLQKRTNDSHEKILGNIISHLLNKSKLTKIEKVEKTSVETRSKVVHIPIDYDNLNEMHAILSRALNEKPVITETISPTESLVTLQQNLKTAVTNYMANHFVANINKGTRAASDRRLNDMLEILEIIDNGTLTGDRDLKAQLSTRLKKIEGFFGSGFFSRSSLRNDLIKVLDKHKYMDKMPELAPVNKK